METIRIGVIGAGTNTTLHHIPKLQGISGVEVVAVSNRSRESGQRVADECGIAQVYDHWSELLADEAIDAVVIGTWPNMHAQLSIAALRANKHVLCEARLARTLAEAQAMQAEALLHPQRIAQVVPSPYTLHVDATVRGLLPSIGNLVSVEVVDRGGWADPQATQTWRQDREISGVNMMTLGIWYEALMRWVGEADRVSALAATTVPLRRDGAGVPQPVAIPDHLDLLGTLAAGGQLRMLISQATGPAATTTIRLYGTSGTIEVVDGAVVTHSADAGAVPVEIPADTAIGWRVEEEFIGAIRGTEPVRHTTFADGVRYMRFTEAVYRSIHEKRQVSLSELG